jgi:hypothetical protein
MKMTKRQAKAIAPVVSTLFLMAVMMIGVTLGFSFIQANLALRSAEYDFVAAKSFMERVGLHIDDVAWVTGRTETVRYTAQNGELDVERAVLRYSIQLYDGTDPSPISEFSFDVGAIFFNIPTSLYSLSDGYFERIHPEISEELVVSGTSGPITQVFAIQPHSIPNEDAYLKVAIAPLLRYVVSNVSLPGQSISYIRFYLLSPIVGDAPATSQSITLTGKSIALYRASDIDHIQVTVSFPQLDQGYDNNFFQFPQVTQTINVPTGTEFELFMSEVEVNIGL